MDIREMVRPNFSQPKDNISQVKKTMSDIETVKNTVNTAKELAGTSDLESRTQEYREERNAERIRAEEAEKKAHALEIDGVRSELRAEVDRIKDLVQPKSIKDQLEEIMTIANTIQGGGNGSDPLGQLQSALGILQQINPPKSLSQQLEEMNAVQKMVNGDKPASAPPEVTLQLEKMKGDRELELEQLKTARQEQQQRFEIMMKNADRQWELALKKFEEDQNYRKSELAIKSQESKEKNAMFTGAVDKVASVIARATAEGAISTQPGADGGPTHHRNSQQAQKVPTVEANVGEGGTFPCTCGSQVPVAPDSTSALCPSCGTIYQVVRTGEAPHPEGPPQDMYNPEYVEPAVLE